MRIKTKVEFSGVPKGTTGTIEKDGKLWKVIWDLPGGTKNLTDWFSNEEKERFLEVI